MRLKLLPPTIQSVVSPNPTQLTALTREMPDPPQTAPPSPILAQGDPEGLVPIPPNKPLPSLGFSCLASVARRSPFFSAIFLYAFLVGGIAGVAKWSYNRDARPAYEQIPYNDSGVSFRDLISPG